MKLSTSYRWIAPFYDWVVAVPSKAARRASLAHIPPSGHLLILISGLGTVAMAAPRAEIAMSMPTRSNSFRLVRRLTRVTMRRTPS